MKKLLKFVNLVFGLILLALIGWIIIAFLRLYWQSVTSLEPNLASAIVAASATVIVAVLTIVIGKYYERKKEIESQQREKKIEVYEEFMEKWFELLVLSRSKDKSSNILEDEEFTRFLSKFTRKLILWGSDGVVKKYSSFRQGSLTQTPDSAPYAVLYNFEQVLFEIRKDIGHSNQSLKTGDLLMLFINDLHQTTGKQERKP